MAGVAVGRGVAVGVGVAWLPLKLAGFCEVNCVVDGNPVVVVPPALGASALAMAEAWSGTACETAVWIAADWAGTAAATAAAMAGALAGTTAATAAATAAALACTAGIAAMVLAICAAEPGANTEVAAAMAAA